jgi:hypothetical protein
MVNSMDMEELLEKLQKELKDENADSLQGCYTVKAGRKGQAVKRRFNDNIKAIDSIKEAVIREGDENDEKIQIENIQDDKDNLENDADIDGKLDDMFVASSSEQTADTTTEGNIAPGEIDSDFKDVFHKYQKGANFTEEEQKFKQASINVGEIQETIENNKGEEKQPTETPHQEVEGQQPAETSHQEIEGPEDIDEVDQLELDETENADVPLSEKKSFFSKRAIIICLCVGVISIVSAALVLMLKPGGSDDVAKLAEKSGKKATQTPSDITKPQPAPVITEKQPAKPIVEPETAALDQKSEFQGEKALPAKTAPIEESPPPPVVDLSANLDIEMKAFLNQWEVAWENSAGIYGNIENYMSLYSDSFNFNGLDKNGWRQKKALQNKTKTWIRIELTDVRIAGLDENNRANVSFLQNYRSANYSEETSKTLTLKKEVSGWKIVGMESVSDLDSTVQLHQDNVEFIGPPDNLGLYPYTIHISSFRGRNYINKMIAGLKKEGFPAFSSFIHIPGKGDYYRVFIGYFGSKEETSRAASLFKQRKTSFNTVVDKKPYAIQIAIFASLREMKKAELYLWSKGYTPYGMLDTNDKNKTRLLIGAFASKKKALDHINQLRNDGFAPQIVKR